MKLNKLLGFYTPAFLFLKVNTNRKLDAVIGTEDERTLFHELIHFLQDVTTTYGIANIASTVDVLKDQNRILRQAAVNGSVSVPVNYGLYGPAISANKDLFSIYCGHSAADGDYCEFLPNTTITGYAKHTESVTLPGGRQVEVPYIEITHSGKSAASRQFGAMAIMESMANLIEDETYDRQSTYLTFPYDSAEMLALHIHPQLDGSRKAISEVCEAALMYYMPGAVFVEALEKMKATGFKYIEADDAYRFVLNNFGMERDTRVLEEFMDKSQVAERQLDDVFTVSPLSDEKWASGVIRNGRVFRLKGQSLTSILCGNRQAIWGLLSSIGCPLMFNEKFEVWHERAPKALLTPAAFPALYSIFNLLNYGCVACGVQDFCRSTGTVLVDDTCQTAPWTRAKAGKTKHCNYAAIWRMWGLENINIQPLP
jgi:hypothetical protein